ncbi:MAG TPA: thiol peroxidase [Paludibacteraceae bacterium]|mgnify:FL=1|jgi:thiol peroxidase|nr:thiol peroxidase [Paludibacteraceae bacterium]OPZ02941.1 MAG: Thiol peroxidase [Bacteroidetes bacterium ADurb.BinA395]MBP8966960.1 thiol peroxidase [Paludibacteraceae bacterium]HOF98591.1 thiol peroxidase [Paludibacteraceae bacterium]HOJ66131.1 thiol peroxidase [Paludibacteraceae bacterium]
MATVKFAGTDVHTNGELPAVGSKAPDFTLVGKDLQEIHLKDFAGKRVVLNIFPSLDTSTCATSVRKFNQWVSGKNNVVVICVSKDLPFAQSRFCGAEGLDNVITASDFRYNTFATDYGVLLVDGPLKGLMARAVVAIDENGKVIYNQLVDEISNEPNYDIKVLD